MVSITDRHLSVVCMFLHYYLLFSGDPVFAVFHSVYLPHLFRDMPSVPLTPLGINGIGFYGLHVLTIT